jgi:hypothetical protein
MPFRIEGQAAPTLAAMYHVNSVVVAYPPATPPPIRHPKMLRNQNIPLDTQGGHSSLGVYRKEWIGRNSAANAVPAPIAKAAQKDMSTGA